MILEWKTVMENKTKQSAIKRRGHQARDIKWKPPEEGSFKVNMDAAVVEGSESFAIGMVLKDHTGKFIEGKTMRLYSPESVFVAEAIGLSEALSRIASKELRRVTFETDSILTVKGSVQGVLINWK